MRVNAHTAEFFQLESEKNIIFTRLLFVPCAFAAAVTLDRERNVGEAGACEQRYLELEVDVPLFGRGDWRPVVPRDDRVVQRRYGAAQRMQPSCAIRREHLTAALSDRPGRFPGELAFVSATARSSFHLVVQPAGRARAAASVSGVMPSLSLIRLAGNRLELFRPHRRGRTFIERSAGLEQGLQTSRANFDPLPANADATAARPLAPKTGRTCLFDDV